MMRLTKRDQQIIQLVSSCRLLTAKQIQIALFPLQHDSRCQLRLTLLKLHRYLDILPTRLVNQPAIYCISRRSRNAFSLLREYLDDETIRSHMIAKGSVDHLLAINDVRARVIRGCNDLGLRLAEWHRSEDLAQRLAHDGIVPDAYFKTQRIDNGQVRTAAFFLELQRANRSQLVLQSKLTRYAKLYNSGRYTDIFGTRALRILFVFTSEYGVRINHRIETALKISRELDVGIVRCASLDDIRTLAPTGVLSSHIWSHPKEEGQVRLY